MAVFMIRKNKLFYVFLYECQLVREFLQEPNYKRLFEKVQEMIKKLP
jgi:hypothetical protein